jgi:hypothetical protein
LRAAAEVRAAKAAMARVENCMFVVDVLVVLVVLVRNRLELMVLRRLDVVS